MNLARFSIEKSRITLFALATILLGGLGSYAALSRDSMPPYTVRVASIVTRFPGASPERVELLVTDKVEKVAQELPELKEVTSTSRTGLSVVTVTLVDQVAPGDLQPVWDRLRRKLDAMGELPSGVVPYLDDDGVGDVYGLVVGLTSDGFSYAEMKDYADDLRDDLIKLRNAAKVELGGIQDERIFVEFDEARLREYNVSATQVQSVVASTNILSSGGEINIEDERVILEPTGSFADVDDIARTLIPVSDGEVVYLEDIASIRRGYLDPPTQLVRVNGQEAISLHVNLREGANIIQLGHQIDSLLVEAQAETPIGLSLLRISSMDEYIDEKVNAFGVNLLQSVSIVLVVMLVFLGFKSGLVIASLIPIVSIMTLLLMGLIDIGLNQITLAALIMALGMMVDNAIVVAESIVVKMSKGEAAKEAAIAAVDDLFAPLLISTLTTSAAFLAFFLAESTMGDIVGPIFVVISLALLSSWLIALTIIPLACFLFLRPPPQGAEPNLIDRTIASMRRVYSGLIIQALAWKKAVVAGVVALFLLALFGFTLIPFVFFPDSDRNMVTVDINLPQGTRIERTDEVVAGIEAFIQDSLLVEEPEDRGITDWSAYIGTGPESYDLGYTPDEPNSSYAHILINTSTFEDNGYVVETLDAFAFDAFPDADVKVGLLAGGGGGTPIEILVSGEDPDELARIADGIKLHLVDIPGTKNIKDDWGPQSKKLLVEIDQARAQTAGVTSQDVATSLETVLSGFATGEYREGDRSIPIIMRSRLSQQQTLASLEGLDVFSQATGSSVPLLQVASIVPEWQYSKIRRKDLDRTINVSSELTADGNAAEVASSITAILDQESQDWPRGYNYTLGGDAEQTAENLGAVVRYLPLAGFIILFLLVLQFNSMRKTFMVVMTIPLALIGVVIGLLVFGEPFGFMPFLGVISLAGIVINNAIVLLDQMKLEEDGGLPIQDAVIRACLQRFRPIVLATLTTVLGLLPLYLSGGEMWEGMAIGIMVGLLFGTIITLVFIPSLYSILFRVDYDGYRFDPKLLD